MHSAAASLYALRFQLSPLLRLYNFLISLLAIFLIWKAFEQLLPHIYPFWAEPLPSSSISRSSRFRHRTVGFILVVVFPEVIVVVAVFVACKLTSSFCWVKFVASYSHGHHNSQNNMAECLTFHNVALWFLVCGLGLSSVQCAVIFFRLIWIWCVFV